MGNLCIFREKKYCRKKEFIFWFPPPTNKNKIKTLKSHFLGRNFVYIQIAYIIFVNEGFE